MIYKIYMSMLLSYWILFAYMPTPCWCSNPLNVNLGLKYQSFYNPYGMLSNGSCCEGLSSSPYCPSNRCDTYFDLCATRDGGKACDAFYSFRTPTTHDVDSFVIGKMLGNAPNGSIPSGFGKHVAFSPGNISFTISAHEDNTDSLIGNFTFNVDWLDTYWSVPPNMHRFNLTDSNVALEVAVFHSCAQNFLGATCSTYCTSNSSCTCSRDGLSNCTADVVTLTTDDVPMTASAPATRALPFGDTVEDFTLGEKNTTTVANGSTDTNSTNAFFKTTSPVHDVTTSTPLRIFPYGSIYNVQLAIWYRNYTNYNGTVSDGTCCDYPHLSAPDCPADQCDTSFLPCATRVGYSKPCEAFYNQLTPPMVQRNSFVLNKGRIGNSEISGSSSNKHQFSDTYTPGGVQFYILAQEIEGRRSINIANFTFTIDWLDEEFQERPNWHQLLLKDEQAELGIDVYHQCERTYYGPTCGTLCIPNPHYECRPIDGKKMCNKGWRGQDCEELVSFCNSTVCQNGGTCVEVFLGYKCACIDFYEGDNCEFDLTLKTTTTPALTTDDIFTTTESSTTEPTTAPPTTAPTTERPTTEPPTTEVPTTERPTTEPPTTKLATTERLTASSTASTTEQPTTEPPTISQTTEPPATELLTTERPTTPTTETPATETTQTTTTSLTTPTRAAPMTRPHTTESSTTEQPTTEQPTTKPPIAKSSTTEARTTESTTTKPTTKPPTTESTTTKPTSTEPPTTQPLSHSPTDLSITVTSALDFDTEESEKAQVGDHGPGVTVIAVASSSSLLLLGLLIAVAVYVWHRLKRTRKVGASPVTDNTEQAGNHLEEITTCTSAAPVSHSDADKQHLSVPPSEL